MQDVRDKDYTDLYEIFSGSFTDEREKGLLYEYLRPIILTKQANAVGRTLGDLAIQQTGVEVVAIRRDKSRHIKPTGNVKLRTGDILILYGIWEKKPT